MDIPSYWRKAEEEIRNPDGAWVRLKAWGWSSESEPAALEMAQTRLSNLVARLRAGEKLPGRYAYGSRPLREEILEEILDQSGTPKAVVTRNSYGSRILNTDRMLFIDVDVPPLGLGARFKRLFARKAERQIVPQLDRLRLALRRLDPVTFRIYQTAAGFRAVAVSRSFEPDIEETNTILEAAGSDPAFTHLCRLQKSFRARLTPKFWRCGPGFWKKPPPIFGPNTTLPCVA